MPPVSFTQRRTLSRLMPCMAGNPPNCRRRCGAPRMSIHRMQSVSGAPVSIHRHRALALGAAADGGDLRGRAVVAGEQAPRRGDDGPPPVVRPLLRAAARQHDELDWLELPGSHEPVDADERDLGAGRAEVDGEDVRVAVRRRRHRAARTTSVARPIRACVFPASSMPVTSKR